MPTPMLTQYREIKEQHRDAILLFRLGDFYEMFGSDAREGSRLLGLTLTQRQGTPMCGVPHHAAHNYIGRLLKAGRKVAVCEQTSVPDGKTITRREVVEVLSPGAIFDQSFLEPAANNYLVAIGVANQICSVGWCDASTGELTLAAYPWEDKKALESIIQRELARLAPGEILIQESVLEELRFLSQPREMVINRLPDWEFDTARGTRRLMELLQVVSLQGFGFSREDPALLTAGVLLGYLEENARHVIGHIHTVRRHRDEDVVILDEATLRNLEILRNMHDGSQKFSLVEVLDETITAMGSRLLRRRLVSPSRNLEIIHSRLDRVDELYRNQQNLHSIREVLSDCHDLERLAGRLGVEKAHPRDLWSIAGTIDAAARLLVHLPGGSDRPDYLVDPETWEQNLHVRDRIHALLVAEPPVAISEGGIIREGIDRELDQFRHLHRNSQEVLNAYLQQQREETGIGSLKIRYNRMLGHFFELPRSQESRVPEFYIRRQSLANADRFTTPRLSELETEINNASAGMIAREQELFFALRREVAAETAALLKLAAELAKIDLYASLARVATVRGYRRPKMETAPILRIREGRHPVVEAHLPPGDFVTNELQMGEGHGRFALITGPNMAGKSTVLRQTALIVLMAHLGSFVPAAEAQIGLSDRIYCRVGASDNIARGESTFLVEMNETSNILRNATPASLVIMDEVGRGTSTQDGLAIAWSVCEYLLQDVRCLTLFATHYHELAGLDDPECTLLRMAVAHEDDRILFMKKLVPGRADHSYGVDVARLAGLPDKVLARARFLLQEFSGTEPRAVSAPPSPTEGELFPQVELIHSEITSIDPDSLTPREALELLYRWKARLP